jgi:hypothetical protein
MTTYFKAMGTGYFKVFGGATDTFWCDTGTGMENFTKLGDSVYFHDAKDLWVTYYVRSTLNWSDRGLALTQTTDLPLTNKVAFTITAAPTDAVNLQFRKPYWAGSCQIGIAVNGQTVTPVDASGFLGVSRVWQANDKVEIAFPLFVQASRLPDNQNAVAFTYGPIVLSAGLGTASMTTSSHGVSVLVANKPSGLQETIAVNSGTTINDWLANLQSNLAQTAGKLEFNLKNTDSDGKLVFIPHYSRYKDRYGIYWKLSGTAGGTTTTNVVCPSVSTGTGGTGGAGGASGGAGGSTGSGGATSRGGASGSGSGGATGAGGVTSGAGGGGGGAAGAQGTGGRTGSGGAGAGGAQSTGGATTGVGGNATGGAQVSGGTSGNSGSGGSPSQGGATANVGGSATGGMPGGNGGGGGNAAGGSAGAGAKPGSSATGCSCSLGGAPSTERWTFALLLGLGLAVGRRRRRRSGSGTGSN